MTAAPSAPNSVQRATTVARVPTVRPAGARRYSFAFEREQPTACTTSSALTHAVMPAGSGRSRVRGPRVEPLSALSMADASCRIVLVHSFRAFKTMSNGSRVLPESIIAR